MNTNHEPNNCGACGRTFKTSAPKCNYIDSCCQEYPYKMPACIRKQEPDCLAKAVIPSITVDNADGITNLANCFVHVTSTNTTYYIDDKHRPMIIWTGPIEQDYPEDKTTAEFAQMILDNELNLRSQHIVYKKYDHDAQSFVMLDYYYDRTGKPFYVGEYQEVKGV